MSRPVIADLEGERNEALALRKSLPAVIPLTSDDTSPPARHLTDFLLTAFKPLAGHSRGERHPIVGSHHIERMLPETEEQVRLRLPPALWGELRALVDRALRRAEKSHK